MKKIIFIILILIAAILPFFIFRNMNCPLKRSSAEKQVLVCSIDLEICRQNLLRYLKLRKEGLAQAEIDKILSVERDDACALWAKAELLRRDYKFQEAEKLLNQVLDKCPGHASSLISMAYIKYHDNKFRDALKLLSQALKQPDLDRENVALAYLLMGSINSKKATQGGFISKIAYGTRIKGFFEKAKNIAPDMAEAHLGLGTFYLLAPKIVGGDIDKAVAELEFAVRLTPDFATANARLAQAYKEKGDLTKYNFYAGVAKKLDPENEVLKELETKL
ncbi:MAG: hypothetical protein PHW54_06780 [Candidatus Omnitrophica bacterium]|jgi:tetratricopeptide (TPR) repeat protein|nr:hypothetical protein [Candidatus Omnitrophota bacterium]